MKRFNDVKHSRFFLPTIKTIYPSDFDKVIDRTSILDVYAARRSIHLCDVEAIRMGVSFPSIKLGNESWPSVKKDFSVY